MASSYFSLPNFTRAKKNTEELEKTNPKEPVLKDEDEKFLARHVSVDHGSTQAGKEQPTTAITDDGEEKEATSAQQVEGAPDQAVVPDTQPGAEIETEEKAAKDDGGAAETDAGVEAQTVEESKPEGGDAYDDAEKEKAAAAVQARKEKKKKQNSMELPSQEEAEAMTKGFNEQTAASEKQDGGSGEKRTWASYLPSVRPMSRKADDAAGSKPDTASTSATSTGTADQRTWTQYATAYVPTSLPSLPSLRGNKRSSDPDSAPEPVYNDDGSVNETATKEKQEREVSVLLDHLNLSSINNRVFAFSPSTQDIYQRFAQVLKDMINGAPTAYDDMEKLMKEAGPKLESQFAAMPPFVQTLVKSLPMKVGPEILAMAGEKPEDDMRRRMQAASAPGAAKNAAGTGIASLGTSGGKDEQEGGEDGKDGKKQKRRVPGLKSLTASQGTIATMLRNTVTFVQTRFPFLASTTNVVMSLSVFILMFVFWYCHKRGKEVRLAKEAAAGQSVEGKDGAEDAEAAEEEEEDEYDVTDEEEEAGVDTGDAEIAGAEEEKSVQDKADVLDQPEPTQVPLPEKAEEEKAS